MRLIKVLFAFIIILVIANVTLTNRGVDEGVEVSKLSEEITALQNQNTIMRSVVATEGSLGSLTAKLAESGYIESGKVVSLGTTSSVASR